MEVRFSQRFYLAKVDDNDKEFLQNDHFTFLYSTSILSLYEKLNQVLRILTYIRKISLNESSIKPLNDIFLEVYKITYKSQKLTEYQLL